MLNKFKSLSFKNKVFIILGGILLLLIIGSFSENENKDTKDVLKIESKNEIKQKATKDDIENDIYFESDEVINNFFEKYNSIAKVKINKNEIQKGNVKTKALFGVENAWCEIINVENSSESVSKTYIHISVSSTDKKEIDKEFVFNLLKTTNEKYTKEEFSKFWNTLSKEKYNIKYSINSKTEFEGNINHFNLTVLR